MSEGAATPLATGAVLVRDDRGVLRVSGADRAAWLQGLLTNDVAALPPGHGVYSAWLTPQGRMITDAIVLAEDDALVLDVPRALAADLAARLDGAIFAEDAAVADESSRWASLGVHGREAARIVSGALSSTAASADALTDARLAAWAEFANTPLEGGGRLWRHDLYGVPGYELRVPADAVESWQRRLLDAGAAAVAPADVEFARIEAGRPLFLVDMDTETIPLEAGIEPRAISFTKGCYVGQEVIVRVVHRGGGRVARRLVGLRVDGEAIPEAGAALSLDGREIGRVTSAARSPRLGVVALGYARREAVEPGTALTVDCGGAPARASVTALPMR